MVLAMNPNIGYSYKFMNQVNEEGIRCCECCAAYKAQVAIL